MDCFESIENQLISSYESTLAVEGREICKVDSILEDDNLLIEKANTYCSHCVCFKKDALDTKLIERCEKYLSDFSKFRYIKNHLEYLSKTRKEKKV